MCIQIGSEYNIESYHDNTGIYLFRAIILEKMELDKYLIRVTVYTNPRITGTKAGDEFIVSRSRILFRVNNISNNQEALSLLRRD